ncbi:MAG: hypothetical protein IKY96_06120 [Oscillospiraceae bacterium]|nr:hypothetical protein [Oscillospiraceae bacterium]
MRKSLFRRSVSLIIALSLSASLGMTAFAAEEDGICPHHPSHTTDCGYAATGECNHKCSTESGCVTVSCSHNHVATCFDAQGNSLCRHACTDVPACYTPVTDCLHLEHGSCGHSDGRDCSFAVNGCEQCENPATELKGTDVVLTDGTEYTYTGQEIRPHVTVMVDRTVLVENEHYTVTYSNNIGVGTGTVAVTGKEEAGYTGTVIIPFTIAKAPGTPEFTLVEIKGTDVVMEGNEFPYTGQPIEPAVSVTVDGKVLEEGKDYTVTYINNLAPGIGTLTVRGIGTASETLGYYGKVSMDFTIVKDDEPETPTESEKPTEPTVPSEPETPTQPSVPSEPETPTEPTTPSEPSAPEEETKPEYKIIKGSGGKWNQKSGKDLSFTVNADTDDVTGVRIDGKTLNFSHYTLGKNGILTLKNSWLEKQAIGTYRLTLQFEDGSAEGTFKVLAPVDPTNPQTGDTVVLWIGAMTASLLGLAVLVLSGKRIFR